MVVRPIVKAAQHRHFSRKFSIRSLDAKRRQPQKVFCWVKSAPGLPFSNAKKKFTIGPFLGVKIIFFRQKRPKKREAGKSVRR